jgi:hypothetical protein
VHLNLLATKDMLTQSALFTVSLTHHKVINNEDVTKQLVFTAAEPSTGHVVCGQIAPQISPQECQECDTAGEISSIAAAVSGCMMERQKSCEPLDASDDEMFSTPPTSLISQDEDKVQYISNVDDSTV